MSSNLIAPISGVTEQLEKLAIRTFEMRHRVIAHNIANVDSIGFQPLRVNFEEQLGKLQSAVENGESPARISTLADQVQPTIELDDAQRPGATQPGENLDDQLVALTQNTLDYEAMLTVIARLNNLNHLAITGA